jgi:hypothetical protein
MKTTGIGVSGLHRAEACLAGSAYNLPNLIPEGV